MRNSITSAFLLLIFTSTALAGDMQSETKALAIKAGEFFAATDHNSAKVAFSDGNNADWAPKMFNLHVSGIGADGVLWADGAFPELIGMDFRSLTDLDGVAFGKEMLEKTPSGLGGHAMQHRFINPKTQAAAEAYGFCVKPMGSDLICAWSQAD